MIRSYVKDFFIERDGKSIQLTEGELDAIIRAHVREEIRLSILWWAGRDADFSGDDESVKMYRLVSDNRFMRKLLNSFSEPFFEELRMAVDDSAAATINKIEDSFLRERVRKVQEEL